MTTAVVFAYSEVGERCLDALLRHGVDVRLVFSHDDDPAESRWFPSVANAARAAGLAVVTPADPNTADWIERVARLAPDFLFSFYYRHLLSDALLRTARRGALNMHGSLLPKYRGRAPVNWALVHGEQETGASLHYMQSRPDAGPLVGQERCPIDINDTALDVSHKVAAAAERLLTRCLPDLIAGTAAATPLDLARGSYFGRRRPQDGLIDWHRPALEIHNLVRAVAPPFPGAFGPWGRRTLRVLGSLYRAEPARFADAAPCLYVEDGQLYLDGVDGRRIAITAAQCDGATLTPDSFAQCRGSGPVKVPEQTQGVDS